MVGISDLAVKHPYYCSDSNFTNNEAYEEYSRFKGFFEEYGTCPPDHYLVFRWDIKNQFDDNADDIPDRYKMHIYMIHQSKGNFIPVEIKEVTDKDVDQILEFLQPHKDKLAELWKPL